MNPKKPLSYRSAGVDIDAGNRLVDAIKPAVAATTRPEVLGGLGGFGGLFRLPVNRYRDPVLVSGTDGVGTKLRLAIDAEHYQGIGIDLVAMCVNDVLVAGAEPLFFLDYYATGQLDTQVASAVVQSIAEGCRQAGAALIGGETAEMPGMYAQGDFDLAGFCVGVVEHDAIIDGSSIEPGNVILGLASSGAHSNGYSLIRKVLETSGHDLQTSFEEATLSEVLLAPTRIYVKPILALLDEIAIHGMAHITGGGLAENLARVLPANCGATINAKAWPQPAIFAWLQQEGLIPDAEMQRTFNCGIGMCVVVAADVADQAQQRLEDAGETVWKIGEIHPRNPEHNPDQPAVVLA